MKDKSIKEYLFLFLSISLVGCSDPAMEEFERLCSEEAEEKIGKPIEVEGFFFASSKNCNGGCSSKLGPGGFKYIEWLNTEKSRRMGDLELGRHYRMYKAKKDNPYCNRKILKDRDDVDYCIATQPISELLSSYGYKYQLILKKKLGDSEIWEHREEVYGIDSNEKFFKTRYRMFPNVNSAFNPAHSIKCNGDSGFTLYGDLLKAKK